eukprot:CAMPEP_0177667274 /NCGR_PEP_ID=MMETSP0447-20121125/22031_1 /TAXON_ID=0 /ORGANISM="Stygamoeba regulata, Strain BSH-02190019" /LENGTH=102 /DNA_ID=CAMNT_0019173485 /DNA_START=122 /DNA_END=430 /DNA_ORIENTATION=-
MWMTGGGEEIQMYIGGGVGGRFWLSLTCPHGKSARDRLAGGARVCREKPSRVCAPESLLAVGVHLPPVLDFVAFVFVSAASFIFCSKRAFMLLVLCPDIGAG